MTSIQYGISTTNVKYDKEVYDIDDCIVRDIYMSKATIDYIKTQSKEDIVLNKIQLKLNFNIQIFGEYYFKNDFYNSLIYVDKVKKSLNDIIQEYETKSNENTYLQVCNNMKETYESFILYENFIKYIM